MAYTALKPCRFAGQSFRIGESVPVEVIQPGAAKSLVKMGVIAEVPSEIAAAIDATKIEAGVLPAAKVVIHAKEGDMPLELTAEGLQEVVDVLTASVAEAEAIVNGMTDLDALILLDCTDKRKSIGELTKARATELSKVTEDEESAGEH